MKTAEFIALTIFAVLSLAQGALVAFQDRMST